MKSKKLYVTAWLCFGLFACQGASEMEEAPRPSATAEPNQTVEHSSEGVVGPDEAFFAALYLQKAFQLSETLHQPSLNAGMNLTAERVNAFDFAANYTEKRLQLMSHALLRLGDTDGDLRLTEAEFIALKLDLNLFGMGAGSIGHQYHQALFRQLATGNNGLGLDELKTLLRGLAPAVKTALDQLSPQDQRLEVLRGWQNVLKTFDKNGDGSLSLEEQRSLREERQQIVSHIQGST